MKKIKICTTVDENVYDYCREQGIKFTQLLRAGFNALTNKNVSAELEEMRIANVKLQTKIREVSASRYAQEQQLISLKEELKKNSTNEVNYDRDKITQIVKDIFREQKEKIRTQEKERARDRRN